MTNRVDLGRLSIAESLYNLVNDQILPGTDVDQNNFWSGFESILADLMPKNKALLEKRTTIQKQMDAWYKDNVGKPIDLEEYKAFLSSIGYLLPEGEAFVALKLSQKRQTSLKKLHH